MTYKLELADQNLKIFKMQLVAVKKANMSEILAVRNRVIKTS